MRYEIKLQLSTELPIEKVRAVLNNLSKSGKVEVHWIRDQEIGPIGRPNEVKAKILAHLEAQDYPRSAKQIAAALTRAQTTLYRVLYAMVAEGTLEIVEDARWHTKRFGLPDQVIQWHEREARREAKAVADDQAMEEKFKVWRDGLGEVALRKKTRKSTGE